MYKFSITPQKCNKIKTKNRTIVTDIPSPETIYILKDCIKNEPNSMNDQLPIVWDRADNFNVYDISGNKWIDFTSTIFVANVGHSNKQVTASIKRTLDQPLYSCYSYANLLRAEYIERLVEFAGAPFEKAFLLSAGTEATEATIKLMRMHQNYFL